MRLELAWQTFERKFRLASRDSVTRAIVHEAPNGRITLRNAVKLPVAGNRTV